MDPRSPMSPSAFVKPKNIFPDGWFIRQSQDKYLTFAAPYYAVARKAGLRKQFLEVFYSVWFDRWPVTVESDDEYEVNWAISVQQDVSLITLISPCIYLIAA